MTEKKRIAFFPVFPDTLPVVRYFKRYRSDIEVVELLSLPGSGACGKDASYLDNREPLGMPVKAPEETNPNTWDALYILDHDVLGLTELEIHNLYASMIRIANKYNKRIKTVQHDSEEHIAYVGNKKRVRKKIGTLKPINKYIVFVGGVIGETNSFEVFLTLYGELRKYLRVAAFSSSPNAKICDVVSFFDVFNGTTRDESEKVLEMNKILLDTLRGRLSDLVLIHVEEAMLSFNDSLTNGFGIIPYMASQVISPDYSICCLPYDCTGPTFIDEFGRGLNERLGFSPDVWHVSNTVLDFSVATEIQDANVIYMPYDSSESVIKKLHLSNPKIGSLLHGEFLTECVKEIVEEWQESKSVEIIS